MKFKKKPIKPYSIKTTIYYKCGDEVMGSKEFECPNCGAYQEASFSEKLKPQYCSYCGKKLDLEE